MNQSFRAQEPTEADFKPETKRHTRAAFRHRLNVLDIFVIMGRVPELVLPTGGAGYVGSIEVEALLARGYRFRTEAFFPR